MGVVRSRGLPARAAVSSARRPRALVSLSLAQAAVCQYLAYAKKDKCRGFIGLNGEYGDHCKLTGFLPLHAVVNAGFPKM
jgi:hypothetical protein